MDPRERARGKLDELYAEEYAINLKIYAVLDELVAAKEEKPTPKKRRPYKRRNKPKDVELPKVKRTPLLGEVDDIEEQAKKMGVTRVPVREPLTQKELFTNLNHFGKDGAIFTDLLKMINANREEKNQKPVAKSVLSTMLAHIFQDGRFQKLIKRVRIRGTKTSPRATYLYFYIGSPISQVNLPAKAQKRPNPRIQQGEMFEVLGEFKEEGATAAQLTEALNTRTSADDPLTIAYISTKLSHTMKDPKWRKLLKRTSVLLDGKRVYKYVYQY